MVRFVAQMSVDMTDLAELGLFGHWNRLDVPNTVVGRSSFEASRGNVDMTVTGSYLTIIGSLNVAGRVHGIAVDVGDQAAYFVKGLSIALGNIESHFRGNFEPSLFDGNDQVTGSASADLLLGYDGKDRINGRGGADTIKGGRDADNLNGSAGDDRVFGQAGNDRLDGGLGNDRLNGGAGRDSFVFDYALGPTNVDTIVDFTRGTDHILLDNGAFFGIGGRGPLSAAKFVNGAPADGNDLIVYNQALGFLYFDSDGNGPDAAVLFAKVTPGLALTASDFLVI